MMATAYKPRLERQLDGSTNQGQDCGRAVTVMLVDFASKGRLRPNTEQIGKRMNRPTGPSNSGNQEMAVESYDKEARRRGIKPLQMVRKRSADWAQAVELLDRGVFLSVDISYDTFQDNYNGKYSCSRTFRGLHSIAIWGRRRVNGTWMTKVYDPLADGRYRGCHNGPRWVPVSLVRKATAKVWGRGEWGGGVVRYSPRLKRSELPERPPIISECENALREARESLGDMEAVVAEAKDTFLELKDVLEGAMDGFTLDISSMLAEFEEAMPPNLAQADFDPDLDGNDAT